MSKSITVDKFYGGQSEDDRYIQDGGYIYSENLNTNNNGGFVSLSAVPVNLLKINNGLKPYGIYETNGNIITFGKDGYIYVNDNPNHVYKHTGGKDIVAMFENKEDLIFITYHGGANYMNFHKIPLSSINSSSWTSVTEDFISIPVLAGDVFFPAIKAVGEVCYIGIGKSLVKLVLNSMTSTYSYTIFNFMNKPIKGITYSGAAIKVFQEDGIMYIWDGSSTLHTEIINLDMPIRNVLSFANEDYIVGGYGTYYTEFFKLNGYSAVPIFKKSYSYQAGITKNNIYGNGALQNQLSYKNGGIYYASTYPAGLYKYGTNINGLPAANICLNRVSSFGRKYITIYAVYGRGTQVYVAFYDGLNYGVDRIDVSNDFPDQQKTGVLYTKVFDMGNQITSKNLIELQVRTARVTLTQKIVVKYSIDGGTYSPLGEITSSGLAKIQMPDLVSDNSFRTIAFSFDFDATAYPGTFNDGPRLYGFTIIYDDNYE